MKVKNIIHFETEKEVIKIIEKEFKSIKSKKIRVALTGGNSWVSLYKKLFKKKILKKNFDYFITDERYIKTKKDQNYHLLNKIFGSQIKINKFYIYDDISINLKNYQNLLPDKLDIVFVSLGLDGHVLSWFPNDLKWKSNKKVSLIYEKSIKIKKRFTLNKNFINRSKVVFLLIRKKKFNIYKYAKDNKNLPVNHLKIKYVLIED